MGNIVLLDDLTINQIAAGEVIERPASVVKEMVENSIDAEATRITVEIKNGGISFIKVSDNGKGIEKDDLEMAFERHATSKIKNADDILKITSMGFRGEALASIAAIANVEMVSRKKDAKVGNKIVVEGGDVLEKSEQGSSVGTTITVKNLFYNTPVRYKFLKKDYTESGYIEDVITRAALANTNIAFRLINSGKTVIQTSGSGKLEDVIYSIYGKEIAENVIPVEYELDGINVKGVIGKPEIARSNRSQQLTFVNGRYIRNKTITAAIENAYKDFIPANKYAFVVLNMEISPDRIDVNVHPAKLEIKFEDENIAFKSVFHAIKDKLEMLKKEKEEKEKSIDPISRHIRHNHFEELDEVKPPESLEEKAEVVFDAIIDDKDEYREKKSNSIFKKKKPENEFGTNENLMEEVYKFRKGLKEIGVGEVSAYTPVIDIPTSQEEETARDMKIAEEKKKYAEETVEVDTVEEEPVTEEVETVEEVKEKPSFDELLQEAEREASKVKEQEEQEEQDEIEDEIEESKGKHSAMSTPSEEDVEKRTLEIIKNRDHNDMSNKVEQEAKPQTFDDMYTRIFGNKSTQESVVVNEDKMTEKEKNLFDEIRKSVMKKDGEEEKEEIKEDEEENLEAEEETKVEEKTIEATEEDDDVMIQDETCVEADENEIVFSGNIADDDDDDDENEEKEAEEPKEEVDEEQEESDEEQDEEVEDEDEKVEDEEEKEEEEEESTPILEVRSEEELEEEIEEAERKEELVVEEPKEWKNESLIADEELENDEMEDVSSEKYRIVGEAFNQYAIMEFDKEIAIVDLREANEKVLYERLEKAFYDEDEKDNQTMLMADVIPLTNKETNLIKEYLGLFEKAGFELEAFGENTIKLDTVPNVCIDMNTKHLFLEMLDSTEHYDRLTEEEQEKMFIETLAKKVADTIELDEAEGGIEKIIKELYGSDKPLQYEDGKSIAMELSKYEIERRFSRK